MDVPLIKRSIARRAERFHEDFDPPITYGLACRCGHRGTVRIDQDRAAGATFTCSKCGRRQTRGNTTGGAKA